MVDFASRTPRSRPIDMTVSPIPHPDAYALWSVLQKEFERYKEAISYIPPGRERLQEDLRRYLCLRCAGFLEQITLTCVTLHLERTSGGPALEFSKSFFKRSPNLDPDTFCHLIGRFGESHRERAEQFMTGPIKDSLDDLSEVRNALAHGQHRGGQQRINPERYLRLCEDIYRWLTTELLDPIGTIELVKPPNRS